MYSLLYGLLSGFLTILAFPPFSLSYLIWFFPFFLFQAYHKGGSMALALLGWGLAFFPFGLRSLPFEPFVILSGALILQVLIWGLIMERLLRSSLAFSPYVILSSLWVIFEFMQDRGFLSIPFSFFKDLSAPWLSIGVALYSHPLRYIASLLGVWGLSFLILVVGSLIHYLLLRKRVVLLIVLISLLISLDFSPKPTYQVSPGVRIGMVQPSLSEDRRNLPTAALSRNTRLSGILFFQKSLDLIIWPVSYVKTDFFSDSAERYISNFAKEYHCYILAGIDDDEEGGISFYSLSGEVKVSFKSLYAVPSLKELLNLGFVGRSVERTIKTDKFSFAPLKGVEIGHPFLSRRFALEGCHFLVGIQEDFLREILWANAIIRSLETGLYFVLSSNYGPSSFISPNGGSKSTSAFTPSTLFGEVPLTSYKTPFVKLGYYWPLSLGFLIFVRLSSQVPRFSI